MITTLPGSGQAVHFRPQKASFMRQFFHKRIFLNLIFVFIGIVGSQAANAQSPADAAAVLQKCVDLPALQAHFPKNANNTFKPLVIMQHAVSFPTNIAVTHGNASLQLKDKAQIHDASEDAYFYFNRFDVGQDAATVEMTYYHDQNGTTPKMQVATVTLQKSGSNWTITNSSIEAR